MVADDPHPVTLPEDIEQIADQGVHGVSIGQEFKWPIGERRDRGDRRDLGRAVR